MPNAPSELGLGMTGFYADPSIPNNLLRKGENILGTIGRTMFFEEEELLNPVTALSGSGPAYFYYFLRSMIEAGKEMGVEEAKVSLLLKQTMLGAYHLLNHDRRSPEDLIAVVASRGGTTEAALRTFADEKVGEGIKKGLLAACRRAKELGS
jgi:pyrroline-5-carboxylate reductase